MLMKLFVIKMVASNFLGLFNKVMMILFSSFSFENSSNSVFDSEKKATSAPEINAEKTKSVSNAILLVMIKISEVRNCKDSGSGSKFKSLDY